jgi:hypothetical protein
MDAKKLFTQGLGLTSGSNVPIHGIDSWIQLLQKGKPVAVFTSRRVSTLVSSAHFIIVTGAHKHRYVAPKIANLISIDHAAEQILGKGVLDIIDPRLDAPWEEELSIRDMDVLTGQLGPLFGIPGVVDYDEANNRVRTYY